MTTPTLLAWLRRDEGLNLRAYPDPVSGGAPWTIGYGHTGPEVFPGVVFTLAQAEAALAADVAHAEGLCDRFIPWWRDLNDPRQDVIVTLMFNMGWLSPDQKHGLGTFKNTLGAIQRGDYAAGAAGMLKSAWASQVHQRANRLAAVMQTGAYPS